jgi:hypothetical protein
MSAKVRPLMGFVTTKSLSRLLAIRGVVMYPKIVCLCGSTRFKDAFVQANLEETLKGKIVVTIGCDTRSDDEIFANMTPHEKMVTKCKLEALHMCKIDLADEVLILNVGGYIGESTCRELEYARLVGKTIRFLEDYAV